MQELEKTFGIQPQRTQGLAARSRAQAIANSSFHTHWLPSSEIGAQYLLLLLDSILLFLSPTE